MFVTSDDDDVGHIQIVKTLLNKDADPDEANNDGEWDWRRGDLSVADAFQLILTDIAPPSPTSPIHELHTKVSHLSFMRPKVAMWL